MRKEEKNNRWERIIEEGTMLLNSGVKGYPQKPEDENDPTKEMMKRRKRRGEGTLKVESKATTHSQSAPT